MALRKPPEEDTKSTLRRIAEEKAKQQVKKQGKRIAKAVAKKAVSALYALAKTAIALLVKALLALVSYIGLPLLAICTGIIILLVLIFIISSMLLGSGNIDDGDIELKELHEFIKESASNTVDMSRPEQRPYRVPEELISSVIQIDSITKEREDDPKKLITDISSILRPMFEYTTFEEYYETQVTTCRDNDCVTSPIERTDYEIDRLTFVDAWNGYTEFTYEGRLSPWSQSVSTYVEQEEYEYEENYYTEENGALVEKQRTMTGTNSVLVEVTTLSRTYSHLGTSSYIEDYTTFDNMLNEIGYNLNDKKLTEALYETSSGKIMGYSDWLLQYGEKYNPFYFDGTIIPGGGVPPQYMPYYLSAQEMYGIPWYILAAIHFVETGFSTHPTMISSVGAIGPMQFMPATWVGWKYNIGKGLISFDVDYTSLQVIRDGGGYGVDGNGDGKADPWNEADAIHAAAKLLASNGFDTDPRKAIWHYNQADWYVNKILSHGQAFHEIAVYVMNPEGDIPTITKGLFMVPATGTVSSGFGTRWGKKHNGLDIAQGNRRNVPVVAAAEGVVRRNYRSTDYGNVIFIQHELNGEVYETVYAHLAQLPKFKVGDLVDKGQFLAYMGNTGRSTGPHLHFELHKGGLWNETKSNAVNPILYIQ